MDTSERLASLSRDELLVLVAELRRQLVELSASNAALRAEIDQLKRGGKRQAAPFSKGTRMAKPKPPGRKADSGTFCYREAPPPEDITGSPVQSASEHCLLWCGVKPTRGSGVTLQMCTLSFLSVGASHPVSARYGSAAGACTQGEPS
jgi:hypothetical protein